MSNKKVNTSYKLPQKKFGIQVTQHSKLLSGSNIRAHVVHVYITYKKYVHIL